MSRINKRLNTVNPIMGSRYVADALIKSKQNESLVRYLKMIFKADIGKVKALIIDTKDGNTTKSLWKIGVRDITVINYDESELIPLQERYSTIKTFAGSFESFCSITTQQYDFIYYDSCNILHTSYKSFHKIFFKRLLNPKQNLFAVTLSSRQRIVCDPDHLKEPYRIKNWRKYMPTDNYATYFADQLIRDYADRNRYLLLRKPRRAQYKSSMFQLVYYTM